MEKLKNKILRRYCEEIVKVPEEDRLKIRKTKVCYNNEKVLNRLK